MASIYTLKCIHTYHCILLYHDSRCLDPFWHLSSWKKIKSHILYLPVLVLIQKKNTSCLQKWFFAYFSTLKYIRYEGRKNIEYVWSRQRHYMLFIFYLSIRDWNDVSKEIEMMSPTTPPFKKWNIIDIHNIYITF